MNATLFLALATLLAGQTHEEANPLYQRLRAEGVRVSADRTIELTPPLLAAGASAAEAQAAIAEIIKPSYTFEQFARKSVVAPQVLRVEFLEGETPARRIDAYFIAYGDLGATAEGDVLSRLLNSAEADEDVGGQGAKLDDAALASRGIKLLPPDQRREEFAHGSYSLLKRVEVEATAHTAWSRVGNTLVAAVEVDPRFADDAELPNRWRPLERDAAGRLAPAGAPQPYSGVGGYVQLTELAAPQGAILVEWHVVFAEPHGWFDGANLLGSKLPAIVQNRVRAMRRELVKVSRDAP